MWSCENNHWKIKENPHWDAQRSQHLLTLCNDMFKNILKFAFVSWFTSKFSLGLLTFNQEALQEVKEKCESALAHSCVHTETEEPWWSSDQRSGVRRTDWKCTGMQKNWLFVVRRFILECSLRSDTPGLLHTPSLSRHRQTAQAWKIDSVFLHGCYRRLGSVRRCWVTAGLEFQSKGAPDREEVKNKNLPGNKHRYHFTPLIHD